MPTKKLRIYFIGIGGIGVSALAKYYLEKGCNVLGSDLAASEITESLETLGAKLFIGQHQSHRITSDIKLVIYSPAVQKNNPELKTARKLQIKILSYPEALGELTKKYFTIAVSGTHGKSTTTAMISLILIKAGLDPTVIIGTKLKEFKNSNCRTGKPVRQAPAKGEARQRRQGKIQYFLIEADEWHASFLNYWPKIIVLTNIEKEHLDYYKNLRNIVLAFRRYVSHIPKAGFLVANWDDKNIQRLISKPKFKICKFSIKQPETKKLKRILKIPGEHNISNALSALTVARILNIPDMITFKALSEYNGCWRRFEIQKKKIGKRQFVVICDYAHHPTEIEATLKSAREKFKNQKIWCLFQPHQYQRTFYLFKDFVKVFSEAPVNKLILADIYDVAGREKTFIKEKVSSKKLATQIKKVKNKNKSSIIYIPRIEDMISYLKKNLQGGEVVIIMGAGDIYKLVDSFSLTTKR